MVGTMQTARSQLRAVAVTALALFSAAPACTKRAPEPAAQVQAPVTPVVVASSTKQESAPAPAASAPVVHGLRKERATDPPVYVDGVQVGVMRWSELPPNLPEIERPGSDSKQFHRLADYVAAFGVDLSKVKGVQIGGARRTWGSLTGAELTKRKDELLFHFSKHWGGKPIVDWDTTYLQDPAKIDYFTTLAIYVKKPVPKLDPVHHCFLGDTPDDSENICSDKVPYVENEMPKGTRVYVDGKLTHVVKRRLVSDELITEGKGTDSPRYSLARYLDSAGINSKAVKGVELVSIDDRFVSRAIGEQWKRDAKDMSFSLIPHQHGKVKAFAPNDTLSTLGPPEADGAVVNAVLVYRNATPPADRYLFKLDEETAAMESAVQGVGSGTGHGESEDEGE
jgi:hypothetical protein